MARRVIIICFILFKYSIGFCQHTELNVSFQTGVFYYTTNSTTHPSFSQLNEATTGYSRKVYPNFPWGSHSQFSYTVSLDLKRVTKRKNLFGIAVGFESLKTSKTLYYTYDVMTTVISPANGECTLQNNFITTTIYLGKRFKVGKFSDDITAGFYFGISKFHHEWGYAVNQSTQEKFTFDLSSNTSEYAGFTNTDYGYVFQNVFNYKRFGFSVAYSAGILNFEGYSSSIYAYSRFLKAGIIYKLLK